MTEETAVLDSPAELVTEAVDDQRGYFHYATYSPEDNKIRMNPACRLPKELYERVRAVGFIWAPRQEIFVAPMWTPGREDLAIELCGELGDEDTSLVQRAEDRADRFEGYRENRQQDARHAKAAVDRIADGIPMGQPILIGHHSERHARRDASKIEDGMRRAIKMWDTAEYWKSRAAGAIAHAKYKELPRVRARRIKTLEAEQRKSQRSLVKSEMWLHLWRECGAEKDTELQMAVAIRIAGMCWLTLPKKEGDRPDFPHCPTAHDALTNSSPSLYAPRTLQEVLDVAERCYPRGIEEAGRWIAHYENRIEYEKAMLRDSGGSHLLEKKPRLKQLLPICNYRALEGIHIPNMYDRGQVMHYPQVDMTQAEYSKINVDYKGTRVVGNSHRVRMSMQRMNLVCVFLTDAKVHERPADEYLTPPPPPAPRGYVAPPPPSPEESEFAGMKESLKAGVQVAVAHQLFPTPGHLARRMVEMAGGEMSGKRILEPSAGTGQILMPAIHSATGIECCQITAVEVNSLLIKRLWDMRENWHRATPDNFVIIEGDFLEQDAAGLGNFDVVLMNPPFENGVDIKHILHAVNFIAPGGVLVAICANGPRQRAALMDLAEHWEDLPAGTFAESGTNVSTALLVVRG